MKLSNYQFISGTKYRVYFYCARALKAQLYHPDDEFPMFTSYVDGFPHLFPSTLVVVGWKGVEDELDQEVTLAVIPRRDVFRIKPLKGNP